MTEGRRRINDLPAWIQALAGLLSVLVAVAAIILTRPSEPPIGNLPQPTASPTTAAIVTPSPSPTPSPMVTALPTEAPSPPPSSSPSPSPGPSFPTADEAALLLHVPTALRTTCIRAQVTAGTMIGALAVVDCYPRAADAPQAVRYASFPDVLSLDAVYEYQERYAADSVTGGSALCTEPPHTGGSGDYTRGDVHAGRLLCHEDRETAVLAWTYEPVLVYAAAVRDDGDGKKLYEWWADGSRAGPLD